MPSDELSLTYGELAQELVEALSALESAAEDVREAQAAALQQPMEDHDTILAPWLQAYESAQVVVQECLKSEVRKADRILAWLDRTAALAAMRRKKGNELLEMARAGEAQVSWVKELTVRIMREMDLKKCEGALGFLRRHGNGGAHPVDIRQPELLPAKYQRFTLTVSGAWMQDLLQALHQDEWFDLAHEVASMAKPIEPDTDGIRKDLMVKGTCPECKGVQTILVIAPLDAGEMPTDCPTCNTKGWVYVGSVPGAVLIDRGEHLRVT